MALYLSAATIACAFLFGTDESKAASSSKEESSVLSKSLTVMGGSSFLYGVGKYIPTLRSILDMLISF
jgi:ABC-type phosphate transport system substrate-binding protein